MGFSLDWPRERFTMDDKSNRAVREAFVRLYEEGLIFRAKRMINWDPASETVVSDLEVDTVEENGHLVALQLRTLLFQVVIDLATAKYDASN